jgi:hypothetical protein
MEAWRPEEHERARAVLRGALDPGRQAKVGIGAGVAATAVVLAFTSRRRPPSRHGGPHTYRCGGSAATRG